MCIRDRFTRVFPVELVHVDASERFFRDLKGVTEPEAKRKIIGRDFVAVSVNTIICTRNATIWK